MSTQISRQPVLVGVDGSAASEAAVRYAAAEADRTGRCLRLVHVTPLYTPPALPMFAVSQVELDALGRKILMDAARQARGLLAAERVSTSLLVGDRVGCLVAAATEASLVVLGSDKRGFVDRLVTGSTVAGVAARSTRPVVAVPSTWSSDRLRGVVTVGIRRPDRCADLLRVALDIASARGAKLLAVHAWELQGGYDDLIVGRIGQEPFCAEAEHLIERTLAEVRPDYPATEVEVRVEHGQAARVLQLASDESDLLLLERRPHAFPLGHLGATGRAVLHHGWCAVEVLPPASDPWWSPELVLESAGVFHPEEERS